MISIRIQSRQNFAFFVENSLSNSYHVHSFNHEMMNECAEVTVHITINKDECFTQIFMMKISSFTFSIDRGIYLWKN